VQFKVTAETPMLGDYRRTHLLSLIDSVRGKVIAKGVLSEAELTEHSAALTRHLGQPATIAHIQVFPWRRLDFSSSPSARGSFLTCCFHNTWTGFLALSLDT
jgi:hypothetical protein